jgi:hypothetical protein
MNVELLETLVIIESIVYKSNGFAIGRRYFEPAYLFLPQVGQRLTLSSF